MRRIIVFFSWQSDIPQNHSKIKNGLEKACKRLSKELCCEVVYDESTRGKPGSPKIDDAVEKKIDLCDVFVADATPVTEHHGKLCPNSNVMYELGRARAIHACQRIVTLAAKGNWEIKNLPFDINHTVIPDRAKLKRFFDAANECRSVKIGFDSCSMSGIVQWMKDVKPVFLESCEAARFSAFISEDMKMYPCSFMVNTDMYANLREISLKKIWQESEAFNGYRKSIQTHACKECDFLHICNGGCRVFPEINMCNDRKKCQ